MRRMVGFAGGIALAAAVGALARGIVAALGMKGLSPLAAGLLLGMSLASFWRAPAALQPGLQWAGRGLLRGGVALLGLQVPVAEIAAIGLPGALAAVSAVVLALGVGGWLGGMLALETELTVLIAAGAGICGAAAVLAFEAALGARTEHAATAVATVVLFGSLAMLVVPVLHGWLRAELPSNGWAIYIGASVHEVAQVVAAATSAVPAAAHEAVAVKMMRVMLLAPAAVTVAWLLRGKARAGGTFGNLWFAWLFTALVVLRALVPIPAAWLDMLARADGWLLGTAMTALGLCTRVGDLRRHGWRPFVFAGIVAVLLLAGEMGIVHALMAKFPG